MSPAFRNPDSVIWRVVHGLAQWLDSLAPKPPPGVGWCMRCQWNDGVTLAMPARQIPAHIEAHPGSVRVMTGAEPRPT